MEKLEFDNPLYKEFETNLDRELASHLSSHITFSDGKMEFKEIPIDLFVSLEENLNTLLKLFTSFNNLTSLQTLKVYFDEDNNLIIGTNDKEPLTFFYGPKETNIDQQD